MTNSLNIPEHILEELLDIGHNDKIGTPEMHDWVKLRQVTEWLIQADANDDMKTCNDMCTALRRWMNNLSSEYGPKYLREQGTIK